LHPALVLSREHLVAVIVILRLRACFKDS
jgi:hypothetical protein